MDQTDETAIAEKRKSLHTRIRLVSHKLWVNIMVFHRYNTDNSWKTSEHRDAVCSELCSLILAHVATALTWGHSLQKKSCHTSSVNSYACRCKFGQNIAVCFAADFVVWTGVCFPTLSYHGRGLQAHKSVFLNHECALLCASSSSIWNVLATAEFKEQGSPVIWLHFAWFREQ